MQLAHERAFFKLSAAESGARPEYLLPPTALKANQRKHAARRGSEYCKPMSVLSSSCWPPKAAQAQSIYYGQQPTSCASAQSHHALRACHDHLKQRNWKAGTNQKNALKANQRKHAARRGSEYCKPMSVLSSSCWPPKAAQAQSAYYGQQPGTERKSPRMRAVKRSERRGSNPRQPAWEAGTLPTELRSQVGDNVQANAVGCKR